MSTLNGKNEQSGGVKQNLTDSFSVQSIEAQIKTVNYLEVNEKFSNPISKAQEILMHSHVSKKSKKDGDIEKTTIDRTSQRSLDRRSTLIGDELMVM